MDALHTLTLLAGTAALVFATLEHRGRSRMPLWSLLRDLLRPASPGCSSLAAVAGLALALIPTFPCVEQGTCTLSRTGAFGLGWMAWALIAVVLKMGLVLSEEVIFRGSVLPLLARWAGQGSGVVGSALLFAVAHPGRSLLDRAVLLLDGVGFGLAYVLSGTLWVPVAWHGAKNIAVWLVTSHDTLRVVPGLWVLRVDGAATHAAAEPAANWLDVASTAAIVAATIAVLTFRCRHAGQSNASQPASIGRG